MTTATDTTATATDTTAIAPQWPTQSELRQLLERFIKQRPGLDWRDYGDAASYRAELRSIANDKRDAEALLHFVALYDVPLKPDAFRAFSGRLSVVRRDVSHRGGTAQVWALAYTAGQYFPTEYRAAAASVLASAIYQHVVFPADGTPSPWDREDGTFDRDAFRRDMRRHFGRRIVRDYF